MASISNIYITANCLEGGEKYEKDLRDAKTKNGEVSVMFNTVRRYVQSQASVAAGATTTAQLLTDKKWLKRVILKCCITTYEPC